MRVLLMCLVWGARWRGAQGDRILPLVTLLSPASDYLSLALSLSPEAAARHMVTTKPKGHLQVDFFAFGPATGHKTTMQVSVQTTNIMDTPRACSASCKQLSSGCGQRTVVFLHGFPIEHTPSLHLYWSEHVMLSNPVPHILQLPRCAHDMLL